MKKHIFWMLLALLFATVGLLPSIRADARLGHVSPNLSAQALIAEVNALRASENLPALQVNQILMRTAQTHADYIAGTGVLTQFSADGKRPYQRALDAGYSVAGDISVGGLFAELIHSGSTISPADVVSAWKSDASQLRSLLSPDLRDAGAGMAVANGITYYVLDLGSEVDESPPTSTPETPGQFVISTAGARGTEAVIVIVSTPQPDGETVHIVRRGDALWSIALAYGTTVDDLKRLNRLASENIFEGQSLQIRQALTGTPPPTETPAGTATLGIPTSTATLPVTATITSTATPEPVAPASLRSGGMVVGVIVIVALLAAGVGSLLGRKKSGKAAD